MWTTRLVTCIALLVTLSVIDLPASGQAGVYGVVERVVFEPGRESPERVQVWGAFALIEVVRGTRADPGWTRVSNHAFTNYVYRQPQRGYLYFTLPEAKDAIVMARREWSDLASVAGTRQAVAFGYYDRDRGDRLMRIRDAGATPVDPDPYYTDIGVVKLASTGSHAQLVADLAKLIARP